MRAPKRAVVRDVITYDERSTYWGGGMNWSRTEVHTLTAECGHVHVRRGFRDPPKHVLCKTCERGRASVEVTGPLGVIDARDREIKDPVARTYVDKIMRGDLASEDKS